ncbi:hypothetical protein QR680_006318 [Steinernema hermaphroditum]|uniref:TIL domain-containing protein n=1 Tax=Steinernema hermaphroditum TaxID=289476 RepID=A0AA39HV17_9BILA|nr:hypothetical protein QR680_006318 [Steinernema hermaphroditum]
MILPALCLLLLASSQADTFADPFGTTPKPCDLFEIYYPCRPCPLACNLFQPQYCTLECRPGCDCIPGFIRNGTTTKCVPWLAYCLEKIFPYA